MTVNPCQTYTNDVLQPQLRGLGLDGRQQGLVIADVSRRLTSLLSHWNDSAFRKTALLIGLEEATFYEPRAVDLEIRALVVVGIRNSLIEDLGANTPANAELALRRPVLRDSGVPAIMRAAVEHFARYRSSELTLPAALPNSEDVFAEWSVKHPAAWRVLSHLANSERTEVEFEPSAPTPLDLLSPLSGNDVAFRENVRVVNSGIDPAYDGELITVLSQIKHRETGIFFSDGFKGVSRNNGKLLHIIDFVISHDAAFLTHNYLITNSYAARRHPLLKPCHYSDEVIAKLSDRNGLNKLHDAYLNSIRAQFE